MKDAYSDGFREENVGERSNLCWAKCRVLNVDLITSVVRVRNDLITMIRLCSNTGFVSVGRGKENRCQPAGDVEHLRRKGHLQTSAECRNETHVRKSPTLAKKLG